MKRAIAIGALAIFLTSSYLFFGPKIIPEGLTFLGRQKMISQDTYVYLSFIEQSRQGKIVFSNLYVPLGSTFLFRPTYLLAGLLAKGLSISNIFSFHIVRIFAGIVFLTAAWKFLGLFFDKLENRLISFCLLCFSSGLVMNLEAPRVVTFLSLADSPHLIFSQFFMVGVFGLFLLHLKNRKFWPIIIAGLAMFFLSLNGAFDPLIVIVTLFFYSLTLALRDSKFDWKLIGKITIIVLPAAVGIGYYVFQYNSYTSFISSSTQKNTLSSPFYYYLQVYGFLVPLAILGIKRIFSENESQGLLILSWISATLVLLYSPFEVQKQFINGLHIPIAIISSYEVISILDKLDWYLKKHKIYGNWFKYTFLGILGISLFVANGNYLYQNWKVFKADRIDYYYYSIPKSELTAMAWLKNTPPESIILSSWFYGNLIPGISGRFVFLGHPALSINFDQKLKESANFVNSESEQERKDFLKKWSINYIFLGNDDILLRGKFKPSTSDYLKEVYKKDGDLIYQVIYD